MLVSELVKDSDFTLLTNELYDHEITGMYCGDLLSWVMSHGKAGDLWCTVLNHLNIVAVASLVNFSCIVICEDAPIDEETIIKANQKKINILKTSLKSTDIIKKLIKNEKILL